MNSPLYSYKIREALSQDSSAIQKINVCSLDYGEYPSDHAQADLDYLLSTPFYKVSVVETSDGEIVGYANASDYCTGYMPRMKNLLAIAIDPDHQGHGIGAALLQKVEEWAASDGAHGVRLVSGYNREAAHAFYQRQGYTMRKEQKNFIKFFI